MAGEVEGLDCRRYLGEGLPMQVSQIPTFDQTSTQGLAWVIGTETIAPNDTQLITRRTEIWSLLGKCLSFFRDSHYISRAVSIIRTITRGLQ